MAQTLDKLSQLKESNKLLEQCIYAYRDVLDIETTPDPLYRLAGERAVDRAKFRGNF